MEAPVSFRIVRASSTFQRCSLGRLSSSTRVFFAMARFLAKLLAHNPCRGPSRTGDKSNGVRPLFVDFEEIN